MTLTDFLLARIDEDEALANAATNSPWAVDKDGCCVYADHADEHSVAELTWENAPHIARWDPARVLAECEAKRRIVEHLRAGMVYIGLGGMPSARDFVPGQPGDTPSDTLVLRLLALVYVSHPDYREVWRP